MAKNIVATEPNLELLPISKQKVVNLQKYHIL